MNIIAILKVVKIGTYSKTRILHFAMKACFLIFIIISDDREMIAAF
jgi:thiosulfate reductase cytochrome b subunit